MSPRLAFDLPDLIVSSPLASFEFSDPVGDAAARILSSHPHELFLRLLCDQESESTMLAGRRIINAFLPLGDSSAGEIEMWAESADEIAARVGVVRKELASTIDTLTRVEPDRRAAVLRQRAPVGLVAGCWLDTLSQPATQPSVIVNRLFAHHFRYKGEGNPKRAVHRIRRHALEAAGVYLPEIDARNFLQQADCRPLTAVHASFYLALSRLPANFIPEIVGVHYVFNALGVDDLLLATPSVLPEPMLRNTLTEYLALTRESGDGVAERQRLHAAVRVALMLEREHVAMLAELADRLGGLSLDAKVAAIVERHAPMAGRQHRNVRISGRLLSDTFDDPHFDITSFMQDFRDSRHIRPLRTGNCRFLRAIKFGGPMFGVFDQHEAATFKEWAEAVHAGDLPMGEISANRVGDDQAGKWNDVIIRSEPADVIFAAAVPRNDRELFYRLVNIENFANTLPLAKERATEGLADAEILFTHGAQGKYTDASYFDYSHDALLQRVDRIYWDKLVNPYEPLIEIPDREDVIFGQKTFALGSLIDGSWACRVGNVGRFERPSDGMLFSIYADEMGHGDLRKNHITLIHQVLKSMSIRLPHIRDAEFLQQDELPDSLYGFSIHQICLSLFPDSFYNEILGYNLGIEMFGLGELRLHEMQKLRRHGFDASYEEVHLSIDNFSAGHARQSADIINSYLEGVQRNVGSAAVQEEWRRIWRGYASFAYFVEHGLVKKLGSPRVAYDQAQQDGADLLI